MRQSVRRQIRFLSGRSVAALAVGLIVLFGSCAGCIWLLVPRDSRPTRHARFSIKGQVVGQGPADEVRVTLSPLHGSSKSPVESTVWWQKVDAQGRFSFSTPELEFKLTDARRFSLVREAFATSPLFSLGFELGVFRRGHPPILVGLDYVDMRGWDWSSTAAYELSVPLIDLSKTVAGDEGEKHGPKVLGCGQGPYREMSPRPPFFYTCGAVKTLPGRAPGCAWMRLMERHEICLDPGHPALQDPEGTRALLLPLFAEIDAPRQVPDDRFYPDIYRRMYEALGGGFWWYF